MARYLIDANLPRWFSLWAGGDCDFVHDLGAGWSDTQIWDYAAVNVWAKRWWWSRVFDYWWVQQ